MLIRTPRHRFRDEDWNRPRLAQECLCVGRGRHRQTLPRMIRKWGEIRSRTVQFRWRELEAGPGSTPSAENALQNLIARISTGRWPRSRRTGIRRHLVNVTGCSTISVSDACPVADQSSIIGIFTIPVNCREAQLRSSIDDYFSVRKHKRIVQNYKNVRKGLRYTSQPVPQFIEVASTMKLDGDVI